MTCQITITDSSLRVCGSPARHRLELGGLTLYTCPEHVARITQDLTRKLDQYRNFEIKIHEIQGGD
jgi:hypothetical protein